MLTPLLSLSQRDVQIARIVFTTLSTSLLKAAAASEDIAEFDFPAALASGLTHILKTSRLCFNPVIATAMNMLSAIGSAAVPIITTTSGARAIVQTARTSSNFFSAIELIENNVIMTSSQSSLTSSAPLSEPSRKRAKRSKDFEMHVSMAEQGDAWFQLGQLYKGLGDYDTARSVFTHVASPSLSEALHAEAQGSLETAVEKLDMDDDERSGQSESLAHVIKGTTSMRSFYFSLSCLFCLYS